MPVMIEEYAQAWDELTAPGAQFAIKEITVRDVPIKVFESALPSMRFVWELASAFGDRDYVVYEDERYTYAQADAIVRSLAHHLRDVHGVGSGDRVAIAMRNYPEWVFSYWAIVSIGAACVGMNAWWTTDEMKYGLADSAPKVVIADSERVERILPMLDELRTTNPLHVITVRYDGDLPADASRWDDVVRSRVGTRRPAGRRDRPRRRRLHLLHLGHDGLPEGRPADPPWIGPQPDAHHLHDDRRRRWPRRRPARHRRPPALDADGNPRPERVHGADAAVPRHGQQLPPPPGHDLGGSRLVLTYKWDAGRALELIEREGVTNFSGVPTMSRELLIASRLGDARHLHAVGNGRWRRAAATRPRRQDRQVARRVRRRAEHGLRADRDARHRHRQRGALYVSKPSSCGRGRADARRKLIDETGDEVPAGGTGELCVRGSVVIKGYLNRPEATAEGIPNGWFHTGDIAHVDDDGFVFIVDRAKDMVLRGGENVYCSEVEAAIYEHPGVAEVAVFGVPDDRLGEIVGAAIVLAPGATLTEDELRAESSPTGSPSSRSPSAIWILNEPLPRNANGKFVKRDLKAQLLGT